VIDEFDSLLTNSPGSVLFLYDLTGNMGKPWLDAGYTVHIVDSQHKYGRRVRKDGVVCWGVDLRGGWLPPREITDQLRFIGAFPPCDHMAVSGSRWFKGKGLRSLSLYHWISSQLLRKSASGQRCPTSWRIRTAPCRHTGGNRISHSIRISSPGSSATTITRSTPAYGREAVS